MGHFHLIISPLLPSGNFFISSSLTFPWVFLKFYNTDIEIAELLKGIVFGITKFQVLKRSVSSSKRPKSSRMEIGHLAIIPKYRSKIGED